MAISAILGAILMWQSTASHDPAFVGSWVGTLTYRDYSNDSRVSLGTLLRVYQPKGSEAWVFRYVYDDGPKKVVQDSETISLDWAKHSYVVTSEDGKEVDTYIISGTKLKPDGTGTLILTGKGVENSVDVNVRTTFKISADHLDLLRETCLKGQDFKFRHEYLFKKVAGS